MNPIWKDVCSIVGALMLMGGLIVGCKRFWSCKDCNTDKSKSN